ncbi:MULTISPECIES: hypothetical protein [unclassified Paenibacillus]|uniref:hypothetical protein n=1 Tax=unclassified Paenibacillus TaxID=185978 RepID=UPI001C112039|nr:MULTISPECIES: hypothetical protein [unclassified Paenibacillus]MBU5441544.1 hypothetical protein [Paenibacillus sp. MSJ-34]CAH0117789.1 hypothetical protein PAE9249_00250 [Paenibacillus sp. CECT 9249]
MKALSSTSTNRSPDYLFNVDLSSAILSSDMSIEDVIFACIQQNRLIRFNINKGLGVKLSVPGRLLDYDPETQIICVYHDDEKQVYTFQLNEIDDLVV